MEVFSYHAEGNVLAVDVSANHRYVHINLSQNRVLIDIFQLWQVYLTRSPDNLLLKHWVLFRDFRTSLAEFVGTRNRYPNP